MVQLLIFLILAISSCNLLNSFEIEPKQSVVLPGTQFKLKFKVPNKELQYCLLTTSVKPNINLTPNALNKTNIYYYGDGLKEGECGVIIDNVTDDLNGLLTFVFASLDSTDAEQGSTTLIVARPPDSINFVVMKNKVAVDESVDFQIGDELTASCTVKNGRPEPNVTLFFGNEMVSVDVDNLNLPSQQSNAYYFSKNLTQDDDQKEIKCMIDHITKPENNLSSRRIRVKYRPIISETMHQKSDNVMNISLQIAANPLVYHYELLHGGKPLDKNNEHIQVESITQREINNGSVSELTILIKTKKLTESRQQIVLNITNDLGSTTYPIKLYMNTINEDFEIGLGMYIIGAVILIVVLAVLIFYTQRSRWVFSDTVHNSIDLDENVEKKKSTKFHLLSHVHLPKFKSKGVNHNLAAMSDNDQNTVVYTKDKKSSTTSQTSPVADTMLYAELDFPSGDNVPKPVVISDPNNSRTDYAEIVYDK